MPARIRLEPHAGQPSSRTGVTATVSIDTGRGRSIADVVTGFLVFSAPLHRESTPTRLPEPPLSAFSEQRHDGTLLGTAEERLEALRFRRCGLCD
jgi:hypothetical protein